MRRENIWRERFLEPPEMIVIANRPQIKADLVVPGRLLPARKGGCGYSSGLTTIPCGFDELMALATHQTPNVG